MKHRAMVVAGSFIVGCVLCFCALLFTGAGHGTYLPLALCTSPTMLIELAPHASEVGFFTGVLLAPGYWALLTLVATARYSHRRAILISLLLAQYVGAAILQWQWGDLLGHVTKTLEMYPILMAVFAVLYFAAQIILWRNAIRHPSTPVVAS